MFRKRVAWFPRNQYPTHQSACGGLTADYFPYGLSVPSWVTDLGVAETCLGSFLLFFNPLFQAYFFLSLSVSDKKRVSSGESANLIAGEVVAGTANDDFSFCCAFAYLAAGVSASSPTARAPFSSVAEELQDLPELLETGRHGLSKILVAFFSQRFFQGFCLLRYASHVGTQFAVQTATGDVFQLVLL